MMGRHHAKAAATHLVCGLFLVSLAPPAAAAVIRVSSGAPGPVHDGASWATAYITVQQGITAAAAGDEVWVASSAPAPAYMEHITLKPDVGLYGGFAGTESSLGDRSPAAHPTVLDGGGWTGGPGGGSVVTAPATATSESVLDGFTITHGPGTAILLGTTVYHCGRYGYNHTRWEFRGGGILILGGSPVIRNCVIAGNSTAHAYNSGGIPCSAVKVYNEGPGGGVYVARGATPELSLDIIRDNSAQDGGGLYLDGSAVAIRGCTFSANAALATGGGVCDAVPAPAGTAPTMTLSANSFLNNTAGTDGGGASCTGTLIGNTFAGNKSAGNGGAFAGGGSLAEDTFTANTAAGSGGAVFGTSDGSVERCSFVSNSAADGGALASGDRMWAVRSSLMQGNTATHSGAAILVPGAGLVSNSTIAQNASPGGAVLLSVPGAGYDDRIVFVNNIVAGNQSGLAAQSTQVALRGNDVWGNSNGNYLGADATGHDGNISADPGFVNAAAEDLRLGAGSPCIDAGDTSFAPRVGEDYAGSARTRGAGVDIGAYEAPGALLAPPAGPLHVALSGSDAADGSSWAAAKGTLQNALDAAWSRGSAEVWVARGTYNGPFAAVAPVRLYGGFTGSESARSARDATVNVTTLDGRQAGSVVYANGPGVGEPAAFALDGFTVQNGSDADRGGGVTCGPVSIAIANNVIRDNIGGLGAGIDAASAGGAITGNSVLGNRAPDAAPAAARHGGGIAASILVDIVGNTIAGNSSDTGGGISGGRTVIRNIITGNAAGTAGGLDGGSAVISDNVFAQNTSVSLAGGAQVTYGAIVTNNTFVSNTSGSDTGDGASGGALYAYIYPWGTGYTVIENNVVAYNSSGIVLNMAYWPPGAFADNDVFSNGDFEWLPSEPPGNLAVDPMLISRSTSNDRLAAGSPAIDAGDDAQIRLGDLDLDGAPRRQGAHVDIGAYEFAIPTAFTLQDAARALAIAGGLSQATAQESVRLAIAPGPLSTQDAVAVARKAAGLDRNP